MVGRVVGGRVGWGGWRLGDFQQRVAHKLSPENVARYNGRYSMTSPLNMTETKTWMCLICGWIYDEAAGDPEHGIAPAPPGPTCR
jgi:hypothetical protein